MIQVFDTSASNTKLIDSCWVYENDTLKIIYGFWTDNGVMAFAIYNKLDKPIYIDWKNSSYIYNGVKLDYWLDEFKSLSTTSTTTSTKSSSYKAIVSQYNGYLYTGQPIKIGEVTGNTNGYSSSSSGSTTIENSSSLAIRPERVTFIPPKSYYYRSQFYLQPSLYAMNHKTATVVSLQSNQHPEKTDTVYQKDFSYAESPLKFRNYLAISFSENSENFFFVDNEFYLSEVKEMKFQTFKGMPIGYNDHTPFFGKSPYQSETSFYIKFKETH